MQPDDIKDLIYDTLEQRFEAFAATQHELREDFQEKLLLAVENKIGATVNGKIDKVQTTLNSQNIVLDQLDKRIQPFEYGRSWFTTFKEGIVWIAGVLTPLGVIWFVASKLIATFK